MNEPNPLSLELPHTIGNMGTDLAKEEPVLYSKKAIDGFSVAMFPLFGAIMMAMNLKRLDRSEGVIPVIAFGILYFGFVIYMMDVVTERIPVHLWNAIGAVILHYGFWRYYIGNQLEFKKRPIGKPLLIAVVLSALLIWAILR